ncbi:MAG: DUF4136 domain-containing protein [Bacteroidota bacterium]|nr:DUF4136 domain-containing protein [Bacteroidota bacterium]
MKTRLLILIGFLAATILYTSCTKDPVTNLSNEESRIYITDHDSTVNFSNYNTYSISDSVAVIENGSSTRELNAVDQAYIDAVKKYMGQAGYTLVSKKENPDLGVDVNHIINTSTGVISYGDYWYNYSGYWDPYYWGYPDYGYYIPYAYSIYQVKEGALSIDILNLKNATTNNNNINVIWTGLIRGSGILNSSVADSQVKALFDQSPYLKH